MPKDRNIQINESKMNSFLEKVLGDISGTYVSLMCCIGDRLNLFKKLETSGPTTSQELSRVLMKDMQRSGLVQWLVQDI
jgi:hypothetical protein